MQWKPNVTVAAIIERDERFLFVEENSDGKIVFNQPAGHLEQNETLFDAVKREVLEETAWQFEAKSIIGIYLYPNLSSDITYLRVCFSGLCTNYDPERELDDGILRAVWMTRNELIEKKDSLRSNLVLTCIDDFLSGKHYPLDLLNHYIPQ